MGKEELKVLRKKSNSEVVRIESNVGLKNYSKQQLNIKKLLLQPNGALDLSIDRLCSYENSRLIENLQKEILKEKQKVIDRKNAKLKLMEEEQSSL